MKVRESEVGEEYGMCWGWDGMNERTSDDDYLASHIWHISRCPFSFRRKRMFDNRQQSTHRSSLHCLSFGYWWIRNWALCC